MKNHTCRNSLRLGVLVGGEQGGGDGMKVERRTRKLGVGEGISVRVRGWDGLQWPAALAVVGGGNARRRRCHQLGGGGQPVGGLVAAWQA